MSSATRVATGSVRARPAHVGALAIQPETFGPGAYARAVRDGTAREITAGLAIPSDVARDRTARISLLAGLVPRDAALTGLAALWVHGWPATEPLTWPVTVAVRRGARPDAPLHSPFARRIVTDSRGIASARAHVTGVLVCLPDVALAVALTREPLEWGLRAGAWALRSGTASERGVSMALARCRVARQRGLSAWDALREALSRA